MANDKGKNRRVEASDEEDQAGPSNRMQTDGEDGESQRPSKKDKGKGRASSRAGNGTQASVKAERMGNRAASDHEDDQEDDDAPERSQQDGEDDDGQDVDLEEDQGAHAAEPIAVIPAVRKS